MPSADGDQHAAFDIALDGWKYHYVVGYCSVPRRDHESEWDVHAAHAGKT